MNPIIAEDISRILSADLPWGRLKGATILITGSSGMIGGYCAKVAMALSRNTLRPRRNDIYSITSSADFIIHCASPASPRAYCADPLGTIKANTVATEALLNIGANMLYLSSGEVYGDNVPTPCPETFSGYLDPTNPRNVYAIAKRRGENICFHHPDVNVKIARISHTYGPGMKLDDGRVFADFVSDIVNKRDITLKSDGLARRPFCYLADTVLGLFTILLKGERGQAYNVGAEDEVRIINLADMLSRMYPTSQVVHQKRADNDAYIPSSCAGGHLDLTKIRALSWEPTTNIEEGFRRTIESYA